MQDDRGNEIVPQAGMMECNHGGIEIYLHPSGDGVYWRRNWGEDSITEWKKTIIDYSSIDNEGKGFTSEDGEPYFIIGNKNENGKEWMYFLNEFIRYDR